MTALGAGLMSAGLGPAGYWEEDDVAPTLPDPSTLILQLDPVTKQYSYDASTRQLAQTTGTLQRVAWLLSTELNSSAALPDNGMRRPKKITERVVSETQALIRKALVPVTDVDPVAKILSIDVNTTGSRVAGTVHYIDLETSQKKSVSF